MTITPEQIRALQQHHFRDGVPLPERIVSKISVDENGCWLWLGTKDAGGYARISMKGKSTIVHRYTYETLRRKRINPDLTIDHLCRVASCVNPWHLRELSMRANILIGRSPSAINARKTHCIRGHEYNYKNTCYRIRATGKVERLCRKCRMVWQKDRRRRLKLSRNTSSRKASSTTG